MRAIEEVKLFSCVLQLIGCCGQSGFLGEKANFLVNQTVLWLDCLSVRVQAQIFLVIRQSLVAGLSDYRQFNKS